MKSNIGLIGLGNAGSAIATRLLKSGWVVHGYDLDPARAQLSQSMGLVLADSIASLARSCNIIMISLPTPKASWAVFQELCQHPIVNHLIIETSTVTADDIERISALAQAQGAQVMDAAIVGGIASLEKGQATFLVGASEDARKRSDSILQCLARRIFYLGETGNGMRMKVINNAVAHTTMVMLLEALTMAVKSGIPIDTFQELLSEESGLLRPLTHRIGERIVNADYEGGMSTQNARKDSRLALSMAQQLDVPIFTLQASHSIYEIACSSGKMSTQDYAVIAQLWEQWTGISFSEAK